MKGRYFTRSELYELVWAKPLTKLAEDLGVSDVAAAKAIRKYGIPMPGRGYWAKVAAGTHPPRTPLPDLLPGQDDRTNIPSPSQEPRSLVRPEFDKSLAEVREQAGRIVGRVRLANDLKVPHHVVRRMLAGDKERARKKAESPYASFGYDPLFNSPFEQRRLKILSSLFEAAEATGYSCSAVENRNNPHQFSICPSGGADATFTLEAPKSKARSPSLAHYPTNKPASDPMELVIGWAWPLDAAPAATTRWIDTEDSRLEDQLTEILVEILVVSEAARRAYCVYWFEEEERAAKQREEARVRARKAAEKSAAEEVKRRAQAQIDKLLTDSTLYRQAADIRSYVEAVMRQLPNDPAATSWAEWALVKANAIDPVLNGSFSAEDWRARDS